MSFFTLATALFSILFHSVINYDIVRNKQSRFRYTLNDTTNTQNKIKWHGAINKTEVTGALLDIDTEERGGGNSVSFVSAHMVHLGPTKRNRKFNGAGSYKARKLAGAISEVREKYASEAQSRGSDAFHVLPPEFRGILEFFSDISRGSRLLPHPTFCDSLLHSCPITRGSYAVKRTHLLHVYVTFSCTYFHCVSTFLNASPRFISTYGHWKDKI